MADVNSTAAPPVPLDTPLLTAGSMDNIPAGQDRGSLTDAWIGFFRAVWAFLKIVYPSHAVIVGQGGAGSFGAVLPGNAGQPLLSNGAGVDPTFQPMEALAAVCDTGLVCTTAYQDVLDSTGPLVSGQNVCGVTLPLTGRYLVIANVDLLYTFDAGGVQVQLVNGAGAQPEIINDVSSVTAGGFEHTVSHAWFVNNTFPPNVCRIQAKKSINAGIANISGSNTSVKAIFIG
jgi:hypothetical protein